MASHDQGGKRRGASSQEGSREFWERRAEEFSEHAAASAYAGQFISFMKVDPEWSVLDMGCGGGTLALPLARMVRSVTAVDFSTNMLAIVERRCKAMGIRNVKTVNCSWEGDWEAAGIGVHDVALASRSLPGDNPEALIDKLGRMARRAVYISTVVGTGPFDRPLFESTGRTLDFGRDYIYYYNLLYEMGIRANVAFCRQENRRAWDSREEAFTDQLWMFNGLTKDEEARVRAYLDANLEKVDGRLALPYDRTYYWAVIWWDKEAEGRP